MKTFIVAIALFILPVFSGMAQGIRFYEGNFETACQTAKTQGKQIFVDFYTTWCGPCKMLAKNVFTQQEVGDFFNKHFVCCKIDAEKEGAELAKKYGVHAFPTLLFVNPQGEILNKSVGMVQAETLIEHGKKALAALSNPDSYARLQEQYPSKKGDEAFLRKYITKMTEYQENPREAFEEYLNIQRSMKENEVEMMEFLMKYEQLMFCGGKAEQILKNNLAAYLDIATRKEEAVLNGMYRKMLRRTHDLAMSKKDVDLYQIFFHSWCDAGEVAYHENKTAYQLELLYLQKDTKAFQKLAVHYLDSICASRSIEDIHAKDSIRYEKFLADNQGRGGMYFDAAKRSQQNLDARLQIKAIAEFGKMYLAHIQKKSEYKPLARWIDYGNRLMPENAQIKELEEKMNAKKN